MGRKPDSRSGIVFFCHGARDPHWREPFDAIIDEVRVRQPGQPVALAFLELMSPTFDEAVTGLVDAGVQSITVVPLFLAPGKHTRRDLPGLVEQARQRWPAVPFRVEPTLTEVPAVRAAIVQRALNGADG